MTIGAPVCRVCGVAHWSREPHELGTAKATASRRPASIPAKPGRIAAPPARPRCTSCAALRLRVAQLEAQLAAAIAGKVKARKPTTSAPPAKRDRRDYQRELMRKRRAAAAATSGAERGQ